MSKFPELVSTPGFDLLPQACSVLLCYTRLGTFGNDISIASLGTCVRSGYLRENSRRSQLLARGSHMLGGKYLVKEKQGTP